MTIVSGSTPDEQAAYQAAQEAFQAACAERDALPGPDPVPKWTDGMTAQVTALEKAGEDWNIARLTVLGYSEEYLDAQRRVEKAMTDMSRSDKSYFRLNIWGMGAYRTAMEEVGMGTFAYDMDDWPNLAEGIDQQKYWDWQESEEAGTPEEQATFLAFSDQMEAHKAAHFEAGKAIPLHKFCSNDGWLVTEDECRMGLDAFCAFISSTTVGSLVDPWPEVRLYAQLNRPDRTALVLDRANVVGVKLSPEALDNLTEDYFCEWLAYLERASQRGGFQVY